MSTIQHEYDAIEMMRITKTDSDENAFVCYVVLANVKLQQPQYVNIKIQNKKLKLPCLCDWWQAADKSRNYKRIASLVKVKWFPFLKNE